LRGHADTQEFRGRRRVTKLVHIVERFLGRVRTLIDSLLEMSEDLIELVKPTLASQVSADLDRSAFDCGNLERYEPIGELQIALAAIVPAAGGNKVLFAEYVEGRRKHAPFNEAIELLLRDCFRDEMVDFDISEQHRMFTIETALPVGVPDRLSANRVYMLLRHRGIMPRFPSPSQWPCPTAIA
jgi:hypothetical protein